MIKKDTTQCEVPTRFGPLVYFVHDKNQYILTSKVLKLQV